MKLRIINIEALIWISALVYLYFINANSHFSFCIFKNLGIDFCPGCGLGRSIHYLMHFEVAKSISVHPLGIFALPVLLHRIFVLIYNGFSNKEIISPISN